MNVDCPIRNWLPLRIGGNAVVAGRRKLAAENPVPWGLLNRCLLASLYFLCSPQVHAAGLKGQTFDAARQHWAYQPIQSIAVPKVREQEQVRTPIDAFLLSKLEAVGLGFASMADRRTLLRRVSYDLTGLPPTAAEVEAFEQDHRPDAWERVVDQLLASPRYGERWARHWLDLARYADTKDLVLLYGRDALRPFAYTYRDYVVRAFNEDLPFDQFIRDQLAADQVQPTVPPWRLAAMGFLTLGRLFDNNPHDQIDDQIDTVSRGLLGLTVSCARCHDHKYDAISMADYYGLYGVFASSERPYVMPLIEEPATVPGGESFEDSLKKARLELETHIDAEYAKLTEVFRQRIGDYLVRAATTQPDFTETTQFFLSLTPDDFRPSMMMRTRRFLDQRVRVEDRVFGPWAVLFALPEPVWEAGDRARRVDASLRGTGVAPHWNPMILDALKAASLTNRASVARTYGAVFRRVYAASKEAAKTGRALSADERELLAVVVEPDAPMSFPRRDTANHMSRPDKDRFGGLVLALDKLAAHATNAPPARAMVVSDLPEPYAPRIFQRGSPSRPGEAVPRGFLRVLNGGRESVFQHGSGRLELAEAIVDPRNPLTARVFVNRVWMHHFGEPLVSSTADFGARSEPPTHPELLDWLAGAFIQSGWSVKSLHKWILMSTAFQQGSTSLTSGPVDPDNHKLGHFPRRRVELEAMRDTLLFVSGRLDLTMGGRPVDVAGEAMNRRRTLYGLVDRQNLPGLFRAFDFAPPDACAERRPRTTVPQQALFALNAPFVMEQARAVVAHPEVSGETDPTRKVEAMIRRVLGRGSRGDEVAAALRFITSAEAEGGDNGAVPVDPWDQFAQVLLATNELVFLD